MYNKRHNDRSISEVLGEFLQGNKRILIQHELQQIESAWRSEMGDMINSYTKRFYIKHGRLEVTITSAPLRAELNMSKAKLLDILNEKIGTNLIKEIILK